MAIGIIEPGSAAVIRTRLNNNFVELNDGKANKNHASETNNNGAATAEFYGHVKVTAGNGLSIDEGLLSMNRANLTTAGAVQLTDILTSTDQSLALSATAGASLKSSIDNLTNNTPPKMHASANADYGLATNSHYGHIKVASNNGLILTDGSLSMRAASTSVVGAVQLEDTYTSNSPTKALTANMGKYLYEHKAETFSGSGVPSQSIGRDGDIYLLIA